MLFFRTKPKVERILVSHNLFSKVAEMRYKVYCEEMGFLEKDKYPNKQETDEYDGQSIHIAVTIGKGLAGYARVILPNGNRLPIFQHFVIAECKDPEHSCEISRFIISNAYRHKTETRREIFRLLAEEILKIVEEQRIHHIYAVLEDWLLKSLRKRGYNFIEVGKPDSSYMNTVNYPVLLSI